MVNKSPRECVVLVPVGGSIEPACEAGLLVLEQRGYTVRRVRGFSQIDVGRNQLATDALRDGFQELLWIDADVAFNPDDVEKLRAYELPIVCWIYAKKNRREFACSFLPGTRSIKFGADGGLIEIQYAGFGFVHTRRSVYETIQRQCDLPECNRTFGLPMIPFFMPLAVPQGNNHWYLGEDYAFCERARCCGFKIMLDTQIRLWHIGSYSFGWEDAGADKERFGNYSFQLAPPDSASQPTKPDSGLAAMPVAAEIQELASQHPWPQVCPELPVDPNDGWLYPSTRSMLQDALSPQTQIIVELGCWTGLSTRFLIDSAPHATVIAVDHWRGSPEHVNDLKFSDRLGRLYEEFLAACWSYRARIIPVRSTTEAGLREIHAYGIVPDLIYIDADHSYEAVMADIALATQLFPTASIVGDDFDWETVRRSVCESSLLHHRPITTSGNAWKLVPAMKSVQNP